jgi:hypothetical protein
VTSPSGRALAHGSKLEFRPVGVRELKGLPGEWELFETALPPGTARLRHEDLGLRADRRRVP